MCEGLAYAHELSNDKGESFHIVHRDISPPNVLISNHGEIKIVDFGLAKASTQLEKSEEGIIKGKFSYLSPEAAHGREVDARADIFAVGIMLWEMLSGKRLFQGKTDYETVKQVQAARIPPITKLNRDADDHLESILRRALAQERSDRYATARALGTDLTRYLYKLGKPVGSFDVAELVRSAVQKRPKAAGEGVSIIDKLIAETLFQFTSLQDKNAEAAATGNHKRVEPLGLGGLDDLASWNQSEKGGPTEPIGGLLDEGGLAGMLEGYEEQPRRPSRHPAGLAGLADSLEASEPPAAPPSAGGRAPVSAATPDKSSAAHTAALLVVIAAGTAAAVWFSGLV
ncbi:MAG: serine/threonine-protein kinase, partial [Myxococcota bacterium]